jgi:predicted lipoprotein with Yx(FWY)xxD motif
VILAAVVAGIATASLAGLAVAKSFTLNVGKNAKVTNFNTHATTTENVATNSKRFVIYTLSGDSKQHPKCTKANGCFGFWPPLKAKSSNAQRLSKASAIKGRFGIWKRDKFNQVTLNGHPLYTFSMDTKKNTAGGEALKSFGGTWHVVKSSQQSKGSGTSSPSPPPMSPSPSPYPGPGY